jgi:hypothetical protein
MVVNVLFIISPPQNILIMKFNKESKKPTRNRNIPKNEMYVLIIFTVFFIVYHYVTKININQSNSEF